MLDTSSARKFKNSKCRATKATRISHRNLDRDKGHNLDRDKGSNLADRVDLGSHNKWISISKSIRLEVNNNIITNWEIKINNNKPMDNLLIIYNPSNLDNNLNNLSSHFIKINNLIRIQLNNLANLNNLDKHNNLIINSILNNLDKHNNLIINSISHNLRVMILCHLDLNKSNQDLVKVYSSS